MNHKLYLSGVITNDAKLKTYEAGEYAAFLKDNKGKRFTMVLDAIDIEKKRAYLAYYWAVIIPRIYEGYKNTGVSTTKADTERKMRVICQLYHETPKDDHSGYEKRLLSVSELNDVELYEYAFRLKIISNEFLNVDFDDPITY